MNARPTRRPNALTALLVLLAALMLPTSAHAAETYVKSTIACSSNWGAGQADNTGTVYLSCGATVLRFNNAGAALANVTLPGASYDIAPSPDGKYLYYTRDSRIARMVRGATGTYTADTTWKLANFTTNAQTWEPRSRFVATDAWGDIYVSNGGWLTNPVQPNVILKYAPDGKLKNIFGTFGNGVGQFNVNMGLTVTRDGKTIYTVEQTMGRVQRFDYGNDGTYHFTQTWGKNDPASSCTMPHFGAPYDIGVDPWGFVYVMDTSCKRVQKFTAGGTGLGIVGSGMTNVAHGLAVDWHGNFYVGQSNAKFKRATTNPEPGPIPAIQPLPVADTVAPTLTNFTMPAPTTTQAVALAITATDNQGVTEMRVANENGVWGVWRAYAATYTHTLSAGYGGKGVFLQVRDAMGNESTTLYRTTNFVDQTPPPGPADTTAPALTAVTLPVSTITQTISIALTATDAVGVAQMRFANEDGTWGAWKAYATPAAHTLTAGYATKGVFVQVRDASGNESTALYRTTIFQAPDAPPAGLVDIADPVITTAAMPTLTATRDVTITLAATDDVAVSRVRFANEDGNWTAWQPYATSKVWTLSANYGAKAVYVQVGDAAWHESTIKLLRTTYQADAPPGGGGAADAQAPVLTSATLPAVTTTQQVAVTMVATDNIAVAQVRFANEDGTWTAWQAYATPKNWTLTAGYGQKLVFVQVRDAAGNESAVLMQRTSFQLVATPGVVDAANPVLNTVTLPDPATTQTVAVTMDATDDVAVTEVRFANEDGNWSAWQPFAAQKNWTLTAGNNLGKLVFAQVRDASGRESAVVIARTTLRMP